MLSYKRALLMALTAMLAACSADDASDDANSDTVTEIFYTGELGVYRSLVYVPASAKRERSPALIVAVHGANTTAEQFRAATRFDAVAARERFIVMYPDLDGAAQQHPLQSWRFYTPAEMHRGGADAKALAEMTQQVIASATVDPQRVYAIGMSAGGFMTSILGATYPDLYTAIGLAEAGGFGVGLFGIGQPIGASLIAPVITARSARAAMGAHARIVPVIHFQGARDLAVFPAVGAQAIEQWLMTNNLVASGDPRMPFPLQPAQTVSVTPTDGYAYQIDIYRDEDGCRVAEQVRIEQMAHYWPGGSDDPAVAGFTDPRAPSAAELAWAFFARYRKSDTALPCVEARP